MSPTRTRSLVPDWLARIAPKKSVNMLGNTFSPNATRRSDSINALGVMLFSR